MIKQIVLDMLKGYRITQGGVEDIGSGLKRRIEIKIEHKDIAKSIAAKIKAVSIDRDEVIDLLVDIIFDHKAIDGVSDSKVQNCADN